MTATTIAPTQKMDASKRGLPVTIITGFLGSGKTTLLNHILTNQEGLKTAVLVNEFGEVGIDNELLITTGDDNMVELSNGCICCTINNDLLEAVYKVLERSDKIDYLVVETTGLGRSAPSCPHLSGHRATRSHPPRLHRDRRRRRKLQPGSL